MKLELTDIKKSYDEKTQALKGVSFCSERPEFISVIGFSGAGKTTLFRILNSTIKPDAGQYLIDGTDLNALSGRKRREVQRRIGTIYQDFCLVESVSCLDNVLNASLPEMSTIRGMFGLFGKARREEAAELLKRVGLEGKENEQVKNLSGGQKQRVAIARALMQHPDILLADEPIASLDPVTGRKILELIKQIQLSDNLTVIMNSHNPMLSKEFSDRIIGLRDGMVIYDSPSSDFTDERIAEIYTGEEETGE